MCGEYCSRSVFEDQEAESKIILKCLLGKFSDYLHWTFELCWLRILVYFGHLFYQWGLYSVKAFYIFHESSDIWTWIFHCVQTRHCYSAVYTGLLCRVWKDRLFSSPQQDIVRTSFRTKIVPFCIWHELRTYVYVVRRPYPWLQCKLSLFPM